MSDAPIPPVTNGVRGGQPHRGRAHKRNHGLSITQGHQKLPSYSDFVTPSQNIPSPPRSPYMPISYSAESQTPSATHSRHHSDLPSFPPNLSADPSLVDPLRTRQGASASQLNDLHPKTAHVVDGYSAPKATEAHPNPKDTSVLQQIVAGILVSLPYLLLSLSETLGSAQKDSDVALHGLPEHPFLSSCVYLSAVQLIFGVYGKFQGSAFNASAEYSHTDNGSKMPRFDEGAFRRGCQRALSIWLPLYAYSMLGIDTVVVITLITLLSGLDPVLRACAKPETRRQAILLLKQKKVTALFIILVMAFDVSISPARGVFQSIKGYLALALAMSVVPSAYTPRRALAPMSMGYSNSADSGKESLEYPTTSLELQHDSTVNLVLGAALGASALFIQMLTVGTGPSLTTLSLILGFGFITAVSRIYPVSSVVQRFGTPGFIAGAGIIVIATTSVTGIHAWSTTVKVIRFVLAYLSTWIDSRMSPSHTHTHAHEAVVHKPPSKATLWLLGLSEQWPLIHAILKERDSRRIFYFMSLNFAFMLVQFSYGIATGSLGLLSDSIHMLFDCFALAVGLAAAVMSKWPPSSRFPYGYGKVDTLAGFANGVFLMIISIEIIYEAIERLSSGSEVHRIGELFFVSSAGLAVNMVGIFAFDHAHHGHSHGDHDHSHANENMHGIFLHILADALGSVAVVSSTILVHFFGWSGWDPIASCLIAILIFASAIPLVISTSKTLLLALPADVEYNLRDTLAGVSTLRGVVGYTVPKFWLDDTVHDHDHKHDHHHHDHHHHDHHHGHHHDHDHDHSHEHNHDEDYGHTHIDSEHKHGSSKKVLGVIHVIASRNADPSDVQRRTTNYLQERSMNVLVQVETEGDGRCWCGGNNKAIS